VVDRAYLSYLDGHRSFAQRWLLLQSLATGVSRRALFRALQLQPAWRVLDLGCGLGPVALELAGMTTTGLSMVGLDNDPANLAVTNALAGTLASTG